MNDILFSSWGGRIIDNRGKEPQTYESVNHVTLPEYFNEKEKIKALIGFDGIILRSADVDIIDLCQAYLEANYDHAKDCDKCNYCKTGWKEQLEVFQDIFNGEATEEDLEFLESTAEAIIDAGKCTIGKAGPVPLLQALKYFANDFARAINGKKSATACKYYTKLTAPCMEACPIHLDIPKYIELIKDAKFMESLDVIRKRLPLPGVVGRVCYYPCEQNCLRAHVDEPISIRALKRFVADDELSKGQEPEYQVTPSKKTGKVAIVGAGPAGITCAYHLAIKGHQVMIFEKLLVAGGMMAVGIPQYRLSRDIVDIEIQRIKDMGIEIKTGVDVGKDITIEQLRKEGYLTVFLSIGAHECKNLNIEGEELEGVYPGIDFLLEVNLGKKIDLGDRIGVIGGGNVAVDTVRTLRRLGAKDPFILYRRSIDEMPAHEQEIEECKKEGIRIHPLTAPKRINGENGKVKAIECIKMVLGEPDESGRPRPIPVEDSEFVIEVDGVIPALGQESDWACLDPGCACTLSDWGTINVNPFTLRTNDPEIFAGGDAVTGPKSLIEATASGRKAAISIDRFINHLPVEPDEDDHFKKLFESIKVYNSNEEIGKKIEILNRKQPPKLQPETRLSTFDEVEQCFSSSDAVAEAERCLRCYRVITVAV
ncbi:dihydropyrimidine dehydrogenase subunit A [Candidatus Woesebacteria bacterium]|nr:MAG: dihydropyrimidine dehydrogenase subunit A [Candidatus Woesebacteria bacterium]